MVHASCDIQMLRGKDGELVIKELSVFQSWHACDVSHTVTFVSPYIESPIPLEYLRQNAHVVEHVHGLDWFTGERPYDTLESSLLHLTYGY